MDKSNNLNLIELDNHQLKNIDGGITIPKWTPLGAAAWLTYEVINNWSDVKSGVIDAYNDWKNANK